MKIQQRQSPLGHIYRSRIRGTVVEFGFTTRRGFCCRPHRNRVSQIARWHLTARVVKTAGFSDQSVVCADQIHSANVSVVRDAGTQAAHENPTRFCSVGKTDGLVTCLDRSRLVILTADCLPIFIIGPSTRTGLGLAHAGWRGTRAGIARNAFKVLRKTARIRTDRARIFFGPCIRKCCYEVGPEFEGYFPRSVSIDRTGRRFFDLIGENKAQLLDLGLKPSQIEDCGWCSYCRSDRFDSYRRRGQRAGRTLSWIVKYRL